MKFEVGRYYKTRSGEKVVYVGENTFNDTYPHIFAFNQTIVLMRTDDGEALEGDEQEDDIISEWPEEVVCWVRYDENANEFNTTRCEAESTWWARDGYQVQKVTFKGE